MEDRTRWCADCKNRYAGGSWCERCEKDWNYFNRASGYRPEEKEHDK